MNDVKEKLYLIAIRNLLKRVNFLELYQQLQNKSITEKEFDKELKNNSHKYIIELKNFDNDSKTLENIKQITSELNIKDEQEIFEMFSIKSE